MSDDVDRKIFVEQTDEPLPDDMPDLYSKYVDFKPLTEGGIASIQICKDKYLGRTAAIKSLLWNMREDPVEVKRFLREARITSLLEHPNIPAVYDLGRDQSDNLFFTMKYLEGSSLKFILNCLERGDKKVVKEYNFKRLLSILTKACYAVAYAHQHGIVHRDLKPGNIQVGGFREVLVLDWGIARVWNSQEKDDIINQIPRQSSHVNLTQMGSNPGTPLYMSPEQVRGDVVDERSDIYSLGTILYEILTLKNVFDAPSKNELMLKIKNEEIERPSVRAPERYIPQRMEEICMKAISKAPEDRYAKVLDFLSDIRDFKYQASISSIV